MQLFTGEYWYRQTRESDPLNRFGEANNNESKNHKLVTEAGINSRWSKYLSPRDSVTVESDKAGLEDARLGRIWTTSVVLLATP